MRDQEWRTAGTSASGTPAGANPSQLPVCTFGWPPVTMISPTGSYAGCFDVTPDWHPVIDEPGPRGFYVAAGFSGHGFKLSPAIVEMVAALVADGKKAS